MRCTGKVTSRFVADFDASWDGNKGRMTEHFKYDNGHTQDREWNLTLGNVDSGQIKRKAIEHGMTTLRMDGAKHILRGLTSIDEVMRVTEEETVSTET